MADFVAYQSWADNLVDSDTNSLGDIFVHDLVTGVTAIASALPSAPANQVSVYTAVDASGGRVAFASAASNLVPGDTNSRFDVFLADLDLDDDGLWDEWERKFSLDPTDPADAAGNPDNDGLVTSAEYAAGSHPRGGHFRYFAEGAANVVFDTLVWLFNPEATSVSPTVQTHGTRGPLAGRLLTVPPRAMVPLGFRIDTRETSFSIAIESSGPLIADRTMSWNVSGVEAGFGSHAESAVSSPSTTWFLAEGATHGRFQLFYLLQNPSATDPAAVAVTYLRPAPAPPLTRQYVLPPQSRHTIQVEAQDPALIDVDVSAHIEADRPILVERSMYFDVEGPGGVFGAGHAGFGVPSAATRWFVAEGATGAFFDLYYLIANLSPQDARVRVTYLLPSGSPIVKEYDLARESRLTISVDYEDAELADTPVSAIVESLGGAGIVVERSMWWPGDGRWQEGHLSVAATAGARRWAVTGGVVGGAVERHQSFLLLANPTAQAGTATVTLYPNGRDPMRMEVSLLPSSRVTIPVFISTGRFATYYSAVIESDGPEIVVERANYSGGDGIVWSGGNSAPGSRLP